MLLRGSNKVAFFFWKHSLSGKTQWISSCTKMRPQLNLSKMHKRQNRISTNSPYVVGNKWIVFLLMMFWNSTYSPWTSNQILLRRLFTTGLFPSAWNLKLECLSLPHPICMFSQPSLLSTLADRQSRPDPEPAFDSCRFRLQTIPNRLLLLMLLLR